MRPPDIKKIKPSLLQEFRSQEEADSSLVEKQVMECRRRGYRYLTWFMTYLREQASDPTVTSHAEVLLTTEDWNADRERILEAVVFFRELMQPLSQLLTNISKLATVKIPGSDKNDVQDRITAFIDIQLLQSYSVDVNRPINTWSLASEETQFDRGIKLQLRELAQTQIGVQAKYLKILTHTSVLEQLPPDIQNVIFTFFSHDVMGTKIHTLLKMLSEVMLREGADLNKHKIAFQSIIQQIQSLSHRISFGAESVLHTEISSLETFIELMKIDAQEIYKDMVQFDFPGDIEQSLQGKQVAVIPQLLMTFINDFIHNASNAESSDHPNEIVVSFSYDTDKLIISVSDTGVGFPTDHTSGTPTEIAGIEIYPFEIALGKTFTNYNGTNGTGIGLATAYKYFTSDTVGGRMVVGNRVEASAVVGGQVVIEIPYITS